MPTDPENVDPFRTTGSARVGASDAPVTEGSRPDPFGAAPPPATVERAVSLVERRAYESPDEVSVLVDVADAECGWWLLSELATARSESGDEAASDRRDGDDAGVGPEDPLVESLARLTRRSTENVFRELHTRLLPKLLVTDVVEHVESVAAPPSYAATVELRSDDDREFVSAVLFLVAVEGELVYGTRDLSAALRAAVGRFSRVVWRIRESSRRASDPNVGPGSLSMP